MNVMNQVSQGPLHSRPIQLLLQESWNQLTQEWIIPTLKQAVSLRPFQLRLCQSGRLGCHLGEPGASLTVERGGVKTPFQQQGDANSN